MVTKPEAIQEATAAIILNNVMTVRAKGSLSDVTRP